MTDDGRPDPEPRADDRHPALFTKEEWWTLRIDWQRLSWLTARTREELEDYLEYRRNPPKLVSISFGRIPVLELTAKEIARCRLNPERAQYWPSSDVLQLQRSLDNRRRMLDGKVKSRK